MDFLVAKDDLHRCRFATDATPQPADGEALLSVRSFGLTSNNITYAMFGEAMSYWSFFPAPEGWGRVPVWGFAEVIDSRVEQLAVGTRVYGYLPPSSDLLVRPARADGRRFLDASPHRAALPSAYNAYLATGADPIYDAAHESEQMLLRPLFFTSFLIDDFLADSKFFAADTVILSSASSKTSSALAFLLSRREGVEVVGLTSQRSLEFTAGLGVYDEVLAYEDVDALAQGRAIYVDMSGNSAVRDAVHRHYAEQLAHSAVVGATHHDRMGQVAASLPGPRPTFFFAPDRVVKRTAEWGGEGFEQRAADAWRPYLEWAAGWLQVIEGEGPAALESAYLDLLDGNIDPASAHVLTLQGA